MQGDGDDVTAANSVGSISWVPHVTLYHSYRGFPIILLRKLRHREGRSPAQSHTAGKYWSWDSNQAGWLQSLKASLLQHPPPEGGQDVAAPEARLAQRTVDRDEYGSVRRGLRVAQPGPEGSYQPCLVVCWGDGSQGRLPGGGVTSGFSLLIMCQ